MAGLKDSNCDKIVSTNKIIGFQEVCKAQEDSAHICKIKNKLTLEGFKIFSLCDAGHVYTFLPVSRASKTIVQGVQGADKTGCTVNHLAQQLPCKQYAFNVYMDNYFSSIPLFHYFRSIGIGTCGTWEVLRERFRPRQKGTNATRICRIFGDNVKIFLKIPKVISDYSLNMNRVAMADQLRSYYSLNHQEITGCLFSFD
ncbi:hypothetical protein K501DRAFT_271402 [Backusella circina FSU 941]|nr:hypothetical protein K501DRAFT_271402 [Backusella circina FSU 941]